MALTQKQENFCLKYVETGNASEAYRFAYRADKMKAETIHKRASELVSDREVAGRIEELKGMAVSKAIMSRTEALEMLSIIARTSVSDIAEFSTVESGEDEDGNTVMSTTWRILNSEEISKEASASIKSVSATKMGPKLEMHDRLAAIQQLSKLQGWESASKIDHTSSDGSMAPTRIEIVAGGMNDDKAD